MRDLSILIFFYMVQALFMILTGAQFFNIKFSKKQTVAIATFYGIIIWVVRNLYLHFAIPFGTHTLILAIIFTIIIKTFAKAGISYAIGISLVSFCLVLLGSGIGGIVVSFIPLTYEQILNNTLLHILFGHLENSVLITFFIITKVYNFSIKTIGEK